MLPVEIYCSFKANAFPKKFLIIFLLLFWGHISLIQAQAKKVAITLDDLPTVSHGLLTVEQENSYFHDILNTLNQHQIQVMGFALSYPLNATDRKLLEEFLNAGHVIGSHSHRHPDLNQLSVGVYLSDLAQADSLLAPFFGSHKYFRFPYLHRGNSRAKKDSVSAWLTSHDYTVVPVSIDNDEYIYNLEYVKAYQDGRKKEADSIGSAYIGHIADYSEKYDQMALEMTGRQINHILLLHCNFINSHYLDEIIRWYRNNGWEIITVEEALQDPVYHQPENYVGTRGISYLERIKNSGT